MLLHVYWATIIGDRIITSIIDHQEVQTQDYTPDMGDMKMICWLHAGGWVCHMKRRGVE